MCILHSTSKAMVEDESLEQEFRAAVLKKLEAGDCDFRGITFPWDMDQEFANRVFDSANLRGAAFHGTARFDTSYFVGHADFKFVDFMGTTTFSHAIFAAFILRSTSTEPPCVVMQDVRFRKASEVRFEGFDAALLFLRDSNISDVRFVDIKWPKRLIEDQTATNRSELRKVDLRTNLERTGNYPEANALSYGEMDAR